jgi:hypothetical protein
MRGQVAVGCESDTTSGNKPVYIYGALRLALTGETLLESLCALRVDRVRVRVRFK